RAQPRRRDAAQGRKRRPARAPPRRARRPAATAARDREEERETLRRRACCRATERPPGCERSPCRQSRWQAPARPPGSPASAAVLVFARTSLFSLDVPLAAARDSFGRRIWPFRNERREERGLPSP